MTGAVPSLIGSAALVATIGGCAPLSRPSFAIDVPTDGPLQISDVATRQSATDVVIYARVRRRMPRTDILWGHIHVVAEFADGRAPASRDVYDTYIPLRGIKSTVIRVKLKHESCDEISRVSISFRRASD